MYNRFRGNPIHSLALLVLALSVVLGITSLYPIAMREEENNAIINDAFWLTPGEERRHNLGSFHGGETISISISGTNDPRVNYTIFAYGKTLYSGLLEGTVNHTFAAEANYYEIALFAASISPNKISLEVSVNKPLVFYPFSRFSLSANLFFFSSWAYLVFVLIKRSFAESKLLRFKNQSHSPFSTSANSPRLRVVVLLSLIFLLLLLAVNPHPFATLENWHTDHARHSYSANLFNKTGFSIFNIPLGKLASNDNSFFKFVTWPEMPHLYPIGSLFLFMPFGYMLESGFALDLVFKIEIALFLALSHLCLYNFLDIFLNKKLHLSLKILGIYLFYIVLVVYSANGMFDSIPFLLSLMAFVFYIKNRSNHFFLLVSLSISLKYQAVIFLFPLVMLSLLTLFAQSTFNSLVRNKLLLSSAILTMINGATAFSSVPFLTTTRPEFIMNGVNLFSPHSQISWELQSVAILLTLSITLLCAIYLLGKETLVSMFMLFSILPSFTMPYFQPWYLPYFFIYVLIPKHPRTRAVTMLWVVFMILVLSFGGLSFNPIHILNNIKGVLNL